MKLVKALLIVAVTLAIIGGAVWQFWLKDQVAFARVATAYGAKTVCSCLHIGERNIESCRNDFTVDVSAITFSDEDNVTRASVLGGLVKAEARYEPGMGCTLVKK
ncbi:hypothetical protein HY29_11300 [Hyphomonas beringensis]|uniref:Uncharacterized protein n=1 Tax=Hyphomonas beringensis TaxID=1280946 RepID=A0A062UGM1_9PROT|nr:hypothetical protein [Hyphomonas beringensis]KCZ55704.1 hypothetical protein HY29_11300 [Hyphomonas beringensis]